MDDSTYQLQLDAALQRVLRACDDLDADEAQADRMGDRLDIACPRGKVILTAQRATKQIWVAAGAQGLRFSWDGSRWLDDREGRELFRFLTDAVLEASGLLIDWDG